VGALSDLPPELVVGWAIWLAGGLALMLWFRRRSTTPPRQPARSRGAAESTSAVVPATPPADDAFAELRALLDEPEQRPDAR